MRSIVGALLTVLSVGLIVTGLYLSLPDDPGFTLVERPNQPVRLEGELAHTVAYFRYAPGGLELFMIVSDPAHGETPLFTTRVRLGEGQRHTLAIGGDRADVLPERFTFVRVGNTVQMSVSPPVTVMSAGIVEGTGLDDGAGFEDDAPAPPR